LRPGFPVLLMTLAAVLAGVDVLWAVLGHFQLDWASYFRLGLLVLLLLAGGRFYQRARPDPRLAAMLNGTGFLLAFSLGASVLNYLLLTRAGARIDVALAALDRAMGFDWPRAMVWMARHPFLNLMALTAYSSMLPQVALLTIVLATKEPERVYRFLLAVALSALACIAIWSFAPSFGAFSVYPPPPAMALALDQAYAHDLVRLLRDGPGLISPRDTKGLIGFPSYHAVLALLVMWHARKLAFLRWPALLLNGAVLLATPIQGGHHLLDVLAAFPVAAAALLIVRKGHAAAKLFSVVNKARNFTIRPVPEGLFRITLKQKAERKASAIKPKLSGFS
jgi:hypothetical protein